MKFLSLHAQNFLTLQKASVKLDDRGLHLIQGVNDDDSSAKSNGAGKSSIADALLWCLFGVTARGYKADEVVNDKAKKDTFVKVVIQNGSTNYAIERYRKHKEFKNALRLYAIADPTGASIDLSKGTDAETQKEVVKILGASYEVFMAAIYSAQDSMPNLPGTGDRELKKLIEEAAGLQRIEKAYEKAREQFNVAKSDALASEEKKQTVEKNLDNLRANHLASATEKWTTWEFGRKDRIAAAQDSLDNCEGFLKSSAVLLIKAKPEYEANVVKLEEIDISLNEFQSFEAIALKAEQNLNDHIRKLDQAKNKLAQVQNKVDGLRAQQQDVLAGKIKPCPACGKSHTKEEIGALNDHIQACLDAERALLVAEKGSVDELEGQAEALTRRVTAARARVPDVSAAMTERAELRTSMKRFEDGKARLVEMKRQRDELASKVVDRTTEENPHKSAVDMVTKQIQDAVEELTKLEETCRLRREKLGIAESVVKVFGPAGVRAEILDTVTPFLNDRTADYLSVLSDGNIQATWTTLTKMASGDLKEKFSIDVSNRYGAKSFKGLSGGEKKKVQVATALALQDLFASRASQPIDLWIGDEIDGALDPAGLERLMVILERRARERGTVLVISHSDLRDWIDEVTTVTKADGVSTVEGSLCD